ncbi:leucyl aminopeptidase family protein [Rheinheimera sp. 1928-s]|uniref:M17 family metallopeptidase n=1 Tax=Rheinheimera sp. 1928-s TaxID=3033803 RepID=UPI002601DE60|nr:leucyl aminopeptidase family protein [Rheinheimera sp. 1928-s]MDF3123940.1 leucyl aminopeptidase family protein [Rheinheimera sp. 1928-s]
MSYPVAVAISSVQAALNDTQWDALIIVAAGFTAVTELQSEIDAAAAIDSRIGKETVLLLSGKAPGQRLVLSPTGPLDRDYDDVRSFYDAAKQGIAQAKAAGAKSPALYVIAPDSDAYQYAAEVAYLGACQALWQPLEGREARGEAVLEPVIQIGVIGVSEQQASYMSAVEAGKRVARDLCGTEPERMAPRRFADYCVEAFAGTDVQVSVETKVDVLQKDYPLLMAVARCSLQVDRHKPAVIRLEYQGEGEIEQTLLFAGKGLVYDTGGADLKIGGGMAGMSRDKGGAAAVAGFLKTVALLKPKGLKIIAEIGAVRNSIGADAFVPDEIITSHAGMRVRIGNTDAEGRLVLADLLSHLREDAKTAVNPTLYSIATLTGHAARAVGPYTALVENGAARRIALSADLAMIGDLWADPSEISRSRREDFSFIKGRTSADDLLSCNNAASSVTPRGHQFPMAFLVAAAGLDQHGLNAEHPLPYCHIDIAGSGVDGGDWQHGKPSAAPVAALAAYYCL